MIRILLSLLFLTISSQAIAMDKVIYGDDNRVDVYASSNSKFVRLAKSTAAQIKMSRLSKRSSGAYLLSSRRLKDRNICASEPYANQLIASRCSGFLVGPDLVVTAGHCVKNQADCENNYWVFGYKMANESTLNRIIPKRNVYRCKKVIESAYSKSERNDYALIRLDRKVRGRRSLKVRRSGKVSNTADLTVIGNPTGLPTKIADGAWVRKNSHRNFFVANLDTYAGNSGSAVFNSNGTVEGILVRGDQDWVMTDKGCKVSKRCSNEGCRGEDVTRITNIKYLK